MNDLDIYTAAAAFVVVVIKSTQYSSSWSFYFLKTTLNWLMNFISFTKIENPINNSKE